MDGGIKKSTKVRAQKAAEKAARKATEQGIKLCPRTPEGKQQRWDLYKKTKKDKGEDPMDYKHWSNLYDVNMEKANKANKAVKEYQEKLGWGETEVTVDVEENVTRRLDIADKALKKGVEHKSGAYTCLSAEIDSEVERDAKLVEQGWKIDWHFDGTASEPLKKKLKDSNITTSFG